MIAGIVDEAASLGAARKLDTPCGPCHRDRVTVAIDPVVSYERVLAALARARGARSFRVALDAREDLHLLDVDGAGELPPLVLLHGFSASGASQYAGMVPFVRPHVRRMVLPDLPGHGLSTTPVGGLEPERMVEAIEAVLEAVGGEPPVVFASSMSGGLAVQAALRRPERVRALVLCSPSGAPFAADELERFSRIFAVRSHRDALDFVDRLAPAALAPPTTLVEQAQLLAIRHAYAWGVRRQFNRPHLLDLLARVPTMRFLAPEELGALAMPVYLIWGRADDVLPPSHAAYYRAHLPPSTRIDTPAHFGHTPFLHQPRELATRLLGFVRSL